ALSDRLTYPSLLLHNLWNIVLSALLAAVLYHLAALYTQRTAVRVGFALTTLYASAMWFYLRAQTSQLYHVLFFSALFLSLVHFMRTRSWRRLAAVWLLASALLLTRLSYALLLPVITVAVFYAFKPRTSHEPRPGASAIFAWAVIP